MIALYDDAQKSNTLIDATGTNTLSGFWVESAERTDDYKGDTYRTSDGTLITWTAFNKYEDNLMLTNMQKDTVEELEDLVNDRTKVYYCPDTEHRSSELYEVMLDIPFNHSYNPLTKRYSMNLVVREV